MNVTRSAAPESTSSAPIGQGEPGHEAPSAQPPSAQPPGQHRADSAEHRPPRPKGVPSARDCIAFAVIPLLLVPVCFTPAWDWMQFTPFPGRAGMFAQIIQALQYDLGKLGFILVLIALAAFWAGLAALVHRKWRR